MGTTSTKLVHTESGWLLSGEKYYTTGSIFADWVVVMASTEGVEGRQYASRATATRQVCRSWMTGTASASR